MHMNDEDAENKVNTLVLSQQMEQKTFPIRHWQVSGGQFSTRFLLVSLH